MATQKELEDANAKIAELQSQLDAAHQDRIQAEADRDSLLSAPIEAKPLGDTHCQPPKPSDLAEYKGKWKSLEDGGMYGLKVVEADTVRGNKTHHVKNETHFADYTPEEFRARFDKQ